jgi:hypothetical protein
MKNWQKIPHVKNIIKTCPFCVTPENRPSDKIGTLEHLPPYCNSPILQKTRDFCYKKIEDALFDIYDFASKREYDTPLEDNVRTSSLQERLEQAATILERTPRPILRDSTLVTESRSINQAILTQHSLKLAILLGKIPAEANEAFDKHPLAHRAGLLHLIPETEFNINFATIIDVSFLGLFPKAILQCLQQYAREVERSNHDKNAFLRLIENLVTAFVYRPITIQKVIHILLSKAQMQLNELHKERTMTNESNNDTDSTRYGSLITNITRRHADNNIWPQMTPSYQVNLAMPINVDYLKRKGYYDEICSAPIREICVQVATVNPLDIGKHTRLRMKFYVAPQQTPWCGRYLAIYMLQLN